MAKNHFVAPIDNDSEVVAEEEEGEVRPRTLATPTPRSSHTSSTGAAINPPPAPQPQLDSSLGSAGNLSRYLENWKNITNDQFILNIIKYGYVKSFGKVSVSNEISPLSEEKANGFMKFQKKFSLSWNF